MSKKRSDSNRPHLNFIRAWAVFMIASAFALPLAAEDAERKLEGIALWAGQAPVGDGTFVTANATITVHRPAQANGAAIVIP